MFPLDQIAPFFQKKQTQDAQELINQIKQEVEGGVKMRNDEPKLPEVPQIQEREINLTLINDKLNYIITLFNKVAEKEGVELEE